MRVSRFPLATVTLTALLAARPAIAQDDPAGDSAARLHLSARLGDFSVGGLALSVFGVPSFGIGVEWGPWVLRLGLGVRYAQLGAQSEATVHVPAGTPDASGRQDSILQIAPSVELQYYLTPPSAGGLSPFLTVGAFKSFAFVEEEQDGKRANADSAEALLSPVGGLVAGGAEYFFTRQISLGLEVGLRFAYASSARRTSTAQQKDTVVAFDATYATARMAIHF